MNGPRFNEFIAVPKVRVIDENGENLGVMFTREAIEQARIAQEQTQPAALAAALRTMFSPSMARLIC